MLDATRQSVAEFPFAWNVRDLPRRHGIRYALTFLISILLLAGCGGSSPDSSDLPPIPPTMTTEPLATPEPTPAPEGQSLAPLEDGQQVTAADMRYAIQVPEFWVRGAAPPAEIAFRESGGTPADDGFAYKVERESLPQSIESVEEYADLQQEALHDDFEDVETLSFDPVEVAGIQGIRAVYTAVIGAEAVLVHQVYLVDDETGFVLTGNAPLDGDTEAARELFNQIAGSFSFPRG